MSVESVFNYLDKMALENLFSSGNMIQLGLVIGALAIGWVVQQTLGNKIKKWVQSLTVSYWLKRVLINVNSLIIYITALLLLGIERNLILELEWLQNANLLGGISKLLLAWVVIRLASYLIANKAVRRLIAIIAWVVAALSIFDVLDDTTTLLENLALNIGEVRVSALAVINAVFALSLFVWIALFASRLLEKRVRASEDMSPTAQVLISKILRITLISIAGIMAVTAAGVDLSALAVFGGALGLGLGFGLQKVVSNLFSGMLLLMDRSIKPGDILELPNSNGTFGWVGALNARCVSIVTRDNKEYLIPNEDFITQPVINWSYTNRLIRVTLKFGVHYNSDPHLVKKIAQETAMQIERVVEDNPPLCHLIEFGDSSLNFALNIWIKDAERGITNVKGEVMLALWDAFKEHNITIPYPHREVFVHEVIEDKRKG